MNNFKENPILFTNQEGETCLIRDLVSEEDWHKAAAVLKVLRPLLDTHAFQNDRARLLAEGYHLIGVHLGERLVSVASYIISPHPIYFRELHIHDMATAAEFQSQGFGSRLLTAIDALASQHQCGRCCVTSRTERGNAHEFYRKNGYHDYSLGFIKQIPAPSP